MIKQAVILAGGMGTRLRPFTNMHPKPMYPIGDYPYIEYIIRQIKEFGINKVILLLGYLSEQIIDYLGDGKDYGLDISYDVAPIEYDTGDRLVHAKERLMDEFLMMYCDNFCPIDIENLCEDQQRNYSLVQISVYSNKDGYTKNNIRVDDIGKVTVYDKSRKAENLQGVDIGYAIVNKKALGYLEDIESPRNFEAIVYPNLVEKGSLYATITEHRYYSIGSWERMELTKQFFNNQPTVFLDRDGTLNRRPPKAQYVEDERDFIWLEGACEAVGKLKGNGYRVILISNQPGIARGRLTEERLSEIHKKMQRELNRRTGYELDAIYYCPHDWDEGCECRKPKPGMFYQAQKDFSLNLTKCCMFGDDERDIVAAKAAGCMGILVSDEYPLYYAVSDYLEGKGRFST